MWGWTETEISTFGMVGFLAKVIMQWILEK
jgi:hypothetical protein